MFRVDSRDPQTSNIPIWRYHCLGEVVFWRSEIIIDYRLIQCIRGFCSSPLPIFKLSLQVPWIDSRWETWFSFSTMEKKNPIFSFVFTHVYTNRHKWVPYGFMASQFVCQINMANKYSTNDYLILFFLFHILMD